MWPQAEPVPTPGAERPTPTPARPPAPSAVFLLQRSHQQVTNSTGGGGARRLPTAGVQGRRRPQKHELMETGTPSTIKPLLHISGTPLSFHSSCRETIFPLLQFPGNLDFQARKASDWSEAAADWDKNNYSSIPLPGDGFKLLALPELLSNAAPP